MHHIFHWNYTIANIVVTLLKSHYTIFIIHLYIILYLLYSMDQHIYIHSQTDTINTQFINCTE